MKKISILMLLSILLIASGSLLGCRGEERPAPKPEDKKEDIPPALNTMIDSIHSIIENVEGIDDVLETKPDDIKPQPQQQDGQQGGQEQQGGGEQSQQKQSSRGETQQGGDQQQSSPPPMSPQEQEQMKEKEKQAQVLEKWKSSKDKLKSIHEAWNEYESTAMKDGADSKKIEEMESSLTRLTSYIEGQDQDGVLNEANNLILALSGFLELYKGNPDGVLTKLEYAARQSYMDAKTGNWPQAADKTKDTSNQVGSLRQIADIEEKQKPLVDKLTLSLEDLEKAIAEENLSLLEIKRDIVIKNIETLKEELK